MRRPLGQTSLHKRQGRAKRRQLYLARHAQVEAAMGKGLVSAIAGVGRKLLARLEPMAQAGELTHGKVSKLVVVSSIATAIKAAAKPQIVKGVRAGAIDELAWHLPAKRAQWYIVKRKITPEQIKLPPTVSSAVAKYTDDILAQPYWTDIAANFRDGIANAVRRAVEDGQSNETLAARLSEMLGGDRADSRGMLIARTETTGVLNYGADAARLELYEQGLIKGKQWLAIVDKDTRPDHEDADGQIVGVDEEFEVGGETCQHPGDFSLSAEQRCNCRCTANSVDADE